MNLETPVAKEWQGMEIFDTQKRESNEYILHMLDYLSNNRVSRYCGPGRKLSS